MLLEDLFHGTPHRFDRFSAEHIGNGEGYQHYGWGLYFASEKKVAEFYARSVTQEKNGKQLLYCDGMELNIWKGHNSLTPIEIAAKYLYSDDFIPKLALEKLNKTLDFITNHQPNIDYSSGENKYKNFILNGKKAKTYLQTPEFANKLKDQYLELNQSKIYHIHVPDSSEFLLWDEDIRNYPKVYTIFKSLGIGISLNWQESYEYVDERERKIHSCYDQDAEQVGSVTERYVAPRVTHYFASSTNKIFVSLDEAKQSIEGYAHTGQYLYHVLTGLLGSLKQASLALSHEGLAGIKYLDGDSRKADMGTYNYVIFDERLPQIKAVEKI